MAIYQDLSERGENKTAEMGTRRFYAAYELRITVRVSREALGAHT